MSVAVLFPNNPSARILSAKLLETGTKVSFYCPDEVDVKMADLMIEELSILGQEQDRMRDRKEDSSFEVIKKPDFSNFKYIVIPNLDVAPEKSNDDFKKMCCNLFRHMKTIGATFSDEVSVVFGFNVSGLLTSNAWCTVWPNMMKNMFVTCSVFAASMKVFGEDSNDRALPISRQPVKISFSAEESNELKNAMEKVWRLNSFSVLEARTLLDFINVRKRGVALDCLGIIGRVTTKDEVAKFSLNKERIMWLPAGEEEETWFKHFIPALTKHM